MVVDYEKLSFHIEGISPLLLHNGRLANPLDKIVREIKKITGKRKKTEEDLMGLMKLEWYGSLYVEDSRIVIPGNNIESMLCYAAKKTKMGEVCKSGILCDGNWPLDYNGPKEIDVLFNDGEFIDTRGCVVGQSRVMRTRPIFKTWSLKFDVSYLPDIVESAETVKSWVVTAGRLIGLCDFTPKFGRFMLKE